MNQLESSVQQQRVGYLCYYKGIGNKYKLGKGAEYTGCRYLGKGKIIWITIVWLGCYISFCRSIS